MSTIVTYKTISGGAVKEVSPDPTADAGLALNTNFRAIADSIQTLEGGYPSGLVSVPYASTIALNLSNGSLFEIPLTGAITLDTPTDATDGQQFSIFLIQPTAGGSAVTFGTGWTLAAPQNVCVVGSVITKVDCVYSAASSKVFVTAFTPLATSIVDGLVTWWRFADTSDSSGNGNSLALNLGTLSAGTLVRNDSSDGCGATVATYVNALDLTPADVPGGTGGGCSWCFDCYVPSFSNGIVFLCGGGEFTWPGSNSSGSWGIYTYVGSGEVYLGKFGTDQSGSSSGIPTGTWTSVIITQQFSGTRAFYFNGTSVATGSGGNFARQTASPVLLNGGSLDLQIRNVRIYDRVLTAAEIAIIAAE